jgi:hypothetical protein
LDIGGKNKKKSSPWYPTTQTIFFSVVGYKQRRKRIQRRIIFVKFKGLPLPSDENLGKISYLNIKINPWRKLKKINKQAKYEKIFFCVVGTKKFFTFLK